MPEELKMFESFFNGQNLNKCNLRSVFFVEDDMMTFGSPNKFDGKKNFPVNCKGAKKYFVAEFWYEYPSAMRLPSTYFIYSHIFQLDLTQLEEDIKIEKENNNLVGYEILSDPESVAVFVESNYDTIKHVLFGKNGKDDYRTLAQEMVKKRGQTVGKGFGLG
ncbi:hypothetical protein [Flavobacterium sp.]|uniref:hypothetical protein n=1 Tax=Flavobacterium sp. TaxID=239 RepID=UPI00375288BE